MIGSQLRGALIVTLLFLLAGCGGESHKTAPQPQEQTTFLGGEDALQNRLDQALLQAALKHNLNEVKRLLSEGADINAVDSKGRTPAMIAVHEQQLDLFNLLVKHHADVNLRDQRSDNPLLYAGAEGLLDFVQAAIAAHADTKLTNRFGGTALIPAADRGHVEIVQELLEHSDVDVNHVNNLGWTALLEAVILGDGGDRHQRIVALLIQHGADVNLADRDGVTPLQHAKQRRYSQMIDMLTAAGGQ